jgi:hypothetical protein
MAYSSSIRWRVTTTDSASKLSSNPSSMFLFFSTAIPNKRRRFITCSLDPTSTSSIIESQNSTYKNRAREKSLEIQPTNDGTFSVVRSDGHKPYEKKINKDETENGANKGLKSGPEKRRPSWQKALFASNKMRSILLLNAITIVYGMYDLSHSFG